MNTRDIDEIVDQPILYRGLSFCALKQSLDGSNGACNLFLRNLILLKHAIELPLR